VGTEAFGIQASEYLIEVTAEMGGGEFTVAKQAWIKDRVVEIAIAIEPQIPYIAGWYADATTGYRTACYWVNGKRMPLELPAGATHSNAVAITVWGGKVYVAGY